MGMFEEMMGTKKKAKKKATKPLKKKKKSIAKRVKDAIEETEQEQQKLDPKPAPTVETQKKRVKKLVKKFSPSKGTLDIPPLEGGLPYRHCTGCGPTKPCNKKVVQVTDKATNNSIYYCKTCISQRPRVLNSPDKYDISPVPWGTYPGETKKNNPFK